jgi:hypothetical protein
MDLDASRRSCRSTDLDTSCRSALCRSASCRSASYRSADTSCHAVRGGPGAARGIRARQRLQESETRWAQRLRESEARSAQRSRPSQVDSALRHDVVRGVALAHSGRHLKEAAEPARRRRWRILRSSIEFQTPMARAHSPTARKHHRLSPRSAALGRFVQPRALGRKVSDEFTVPLCRTHYREIHRCGDEGTYWQKTGIDPLAAARMLWLETHPLRRAEASAANNTGPVTHQSH